MRPEFVPSQHLNQLAIEAFAQLLNNAQAGVLNGELPVSLMRDLFALQQSFFTATQSSQTPQRSSLSRGDHPRAQPLQVGRSVIRIDGQSLLQRPLETLQANLQKFLASQPKSERQVSIEKSVVAPSEKGLQNSQTIKASTQESKPLQENQRGLLTELGKLFNVSKNPELKPYLQTVLQIGQSLRQVQDLMQLLAKHPAENFSKELQKALENLGSLTKELKELATQLLKNPAVLPKLEAHLQSLNQSLKAFGQNLFQENPKGQIAQQSAILQKNPGLKDLLTSLAIKGTSTPTTAATIQQVVSTKLPAAVVAPFTPMYKTESKKLGSTLKKPSAQPVEWEDHHENHQDDQDHCEEKDDEENENPTYIW